MDQISPTIKKAYNATAPLNKLLNNVSSVRVREDGGMGSNYNFSLNGFSGNQVKFFLDGIPMDNFGSSFNLANISVNMAERVEVYKGVLPVSLGADALGGAVNIISRKDANYIDVSMTDVSWDCPERFWLSSPALLVRLFLSPDLSSGSGGKGKEKRCNAAGETFQHFFAF